MANTIVISTSLYFETKKQKDQNTRVIATNTLQNSLVTVSTSSSLFCLRYSVMAGTPEKMLEHLLETQLGKVEDSTNSQKPIMSSK